MIGLTLAGLSVVLLFAGCGSTQTSTVTQTRTVTTTVVRHASTRRAGKTGGRSRASSHRSFAATYPRAFSAKFRARCLHARNGSSYCGCLLHHIERNVPFSVVIAQRHKIFAANPPTWITQAQDACFTP